MCSYPYLSGVSGTNFLTLLVLLGLLLLDQIIYDAIVQSSN